MAGFVHMVTFLVYAKWYLRPGSNLCSYSNKQLKYTLKSVTSIIAKHINVMFVCVALPVIKKNQSMHLHLDAWQQM